MTERCERCNKILNPKTLVYIELSNTDNKYYSKIPKGHISQGVFPFGTHCAKKVLEKDK